MAHGMSKIVKAHSVPRKEYSYRAGDIRLTFALAQDNIDEMVTFIGILEAALEDVRADLFGGTQQTPKKG